MTKKGAVPDLSGSDHGTIGNAWTAQVLLGVGGNTGYLTTAPDTETEEDSEDER